MGSINSKSSITCPSCSRKLKYKPIDGFTPQIASCKYTDSQDEIYVNSKYGHHIIMNRLPEGRVRLNHDYSDLLC